MIYLEDVADWTKSKTGSVVRLGICGVIIAGAVLKGFSAMNTKSANETAIQDNRLTIAQLSYQSDALDAKIAQATEAQELVYYEPSNVGDLIATLQTRYNGYTDYVTAETIVAEARDVRDELDKYMDSHSDESAWFKDAFTNCVWTFPMRESSLVSDVPVIWICNGRNSDANTVYAVTTGVYDGQTDRCGDFKTYYTLWGESVIDADSNEDTSGYGETVSDAISSVNGGNVGTDITEDTSSTDVATDVATDIEADTASDITDSELEGGAE